MALFTAVFNTLVAPTVTTKQYEGEINEVCSHFIDDCRDNEKLCWMFPSTLYDSEGNFVIDYLKINRKRPEGE